MLSPTMVAKKSKDTNGYHRVEGISLTERIGRLSPRRQEIIRPVCEHPRDFVLLSVRSLAEKLKTDPATTVRIVRQLGFSSYREFQRYLHDLSITYVTSLDTMQSSTTRASDIPSHVQEALDQEVKNIQGLCHSLDLKRIAAIARKIYGARRILILGGDLATSLVIYLEYHLTILGLPVFIGTTSGRTAYLARTVGEGDIVIAISFRRGLRQTVEGLQRARANGAYCVGITDTYVSPIARFADECFLASVDTPSFGASYAAPMALLNVILVGCANFRRDRTMEILKQVNDEQRHGFRWWQA